jgi:hypothetical protein
MPNPTISLKPLIGAGPASVAIASPPSLRAQRGNPIFGAAGLPRYARNDGWALVGQAVHGLMTRAPVSSKCTALRVANGTSSAMAWAASIKSIGRVPRRMSASRILVLKPAQLLAAARSKSTIQPECCSISRLNQRSSMRRLAGPDVVRIPRSISAATNDDSSVLVRLSYSQSTTLESGIGLMSSLKTFVSTKIIEFPRRLSVTGKTAKQVEINPRPRHCNRLMDPVIAPIARRSGSVRCLSVRRFGSANIGPVHDYTSPTKISYITRKAA